MKMFIFSKVTLCHIRQKHVTILANGIVDPYSHINIAYWTRGGPAVDPLFSIVRLYWTRGSAISFLTKISKSVLPFLAPKFVM